MLFRSRPGSGENFGNNSQLGPGFYVTPDYHTASEFAFVATDNYGGRSIVLSVCAFGFSSMSHEEVPSIAWWNDIRTASYLSYDYLTAPIDGMQGIQIKFNPGPLVRGQVIVYAITFPGGN